MSEIPHSQADPASTGGTPHQNPNGHILRTLMEHLPDHIYFKDLQSRFIAANRAMSKWMGMADPGQLIGRSDLDFFSTEHALAAFEDEQRIIRTGQAIYGIEEKETWPDGRVTWVSTSKMPLRDERGNIIGTFGLSRDITSQKEAHERLARLAEELREKNKTLEEDLEMARELQASMLPRRFPCFPHTVDTQSSAVRFYHFFKPSTSISGDFFDVLEISDTVAGIFICDVMGHGVRAALVAAIVRGVIKQNRHLWTDPPGLMRELNRELCGNMEHCEGPIFVSAFYVLADIGQGELRYTNAGHPPPLRVHDSQRSATLHKLDGFRPGPALGLFREARYEEHQCPLTARDVILLFTDGLFEVEGLQGKSYDYPDLLQAVVRRKDLSTAEMCRSLVDEFQMVSANREFSDDMCLVAMEVDHLMAAPAVPGKLAP